jgi:hypothetical protein
VVASFEGPQLPDPTTISVQFKGEINDALPRKRHQKRHLEFSLLQIIISPYVELCQLHSIEEESRCDI